MNSHRLILLMFFFFLSLMPVLLAQCLESDGNLNGDHIVNEKDLDWIRENPSSFWFQILKEDIFTLNTLIVSLAKNYHSSCPQTEVNVLTAGAKGNGLTNDGPAFQAALDSLIQAGGGKLFIPKGTYFIDQTLLVGNNIEIVGEGKETILQRGDTKSMGVPEFVGPTNCETKGGFSGRELFRNDKYNCGNSNIYLHDFVADGSLVKTVPAAVTISFSAVQNLVVERLAIRNAPQDAIFVRNGGVHTLIKDNTIESFNRLWFNGGGINIEMHKGGNFPTSVTSPAVIEGNTIFLRAPLFCQSDQTKTCKVDSDCPTHCGGNSNVIGILATWIDGSAAPSVHIRKNQIQATNSHTAIACHGCRSSLIEENVITPLESDTFRSHLFTGITSELPAGGYGENIRISGNTIVGSGKPKDGRAILVSSNHLQSVNATVSNNQITDKNTLLSLAALGVRGYHDFLITGNTLTGISNGPAIEIGYCSADWVTTKNGIIASNILTLGAGNPALAPITFRKTSNISITENSISPSEIVQTVIC